DRRAVRRPPARRTVIGGGAEPGRGHRHARWTGRGPGARRGDPRPGRSRRLCAGPLGPSRSVSSSGEDRRSTGLLRARAEPHATGAAAPLPRATSGRAARLSPSFDWPTIAELAGVAAPRLGATFIV